MSAELMDVQARIATYFRGEKAESVVFVALGVLALVASVALFRSAGPWRHMLWPLAAIGLVQIVVGGSVGLRTDAQLAAIEARLASEPGAVKADETSRMGKVMAGFRLYKAVEVAVVLAGIALVFVFGYGHALHAVGAGLILQGALMLVLDLFAEGRGHDYLAALASLP
ncbi:MAG: hypothetical protein ACK4N5_00245 [Myxococcales bacterium]